SLLRRIGIPILIVRIQPLLPYDLATTLGFLRASAEAEKWGHRVSKDQASKRTA
ncbi:unnamed protein product, partial [marine sediment metagenome]